jgi:protein-glutamine gamma-glutamyltransferase
MNSPFGNSLDSKPGTRLQIGAFWRNLARDKSDTLLLLCACLLVLLPHTGHLPIWVCAISVSLLSWRMVITWQGRRLPSNWLLLPIAVASMAAVLLEYRTLFGRDAGVAMLALLVSCKLLEMRARRDLFVVIFLNLFLILTNFFYSQSIGTGVMMAFAVIALLCAQLSFQFTGRVPPLMQRIRLAGLVFALALPLALVMFVLFPRISGPLWGLPKDAHSNKSGLDDTMSPGNIAHLALSEEIAFRVKFDDKPPPNALLYWRGPVLSHYDGRTWRARAQPGRVNVKIGGKSVGHQVTLEATGQRWLYALDLVRELPQLDNNQVGMSSELQLVTRNPVSQRIRYRVDSFPEFKVQADQAPSIEWLSLPPNMNPRTHEWVEKLRQRQTDPQQQINAILHMFRREPFRYTLNPPLLGPQEIDEFLFQTRAGFCEHYTSAFVYLMRALGNPARVVTGYQGGEINPVDQFLLVRQSDAHAWAEVWIAHRGWVRVDPTGAVAPERVEQNLRNALRRGNELNLFGESLLKLSDASQSWLAPLRNNWAALNNNWNQWVLDYTPKRQRDLLSKLGMPNIQWSHLALLMLGICVVLSLILLLPLYLQRSRIDPLERIYQRLCQQLAKRGWQKQAHEGPQAYALRLSGEMPEQPGKKAVLELLQMLSHAKYGPPAKREPLGALKDLLQQCR